MRTVVLKLTKVAPGQMARFEKLTHYSEQPVAVRLVLLLPVGKPELIV